jgi:hypothetical protein
VYTEPVLLINNDQPQVSELDILLEQGMGADDDRRVSRQDSGEFFDPFFPGHPAG